MNLKAFVVTNLKTKNNHFTTDKISNFICYLKVVPAAAVVVAFLQYMTINAFKVDF